MVGTTQNIETEEEQRYSTVNLPLTVPQVIVLFRATSGNGSDEAAAEVAIMFALRLALR
jgi:hypothetical protein